MADDLEARLARVAVVFAQGDAEAAFALARETAERYPRSSAALTNLGFFYIKRGEPEPGRAAYVRALAIDRDNVEAQRGLAVACAQLGEVVPSAQALVRVPAAGGPAVEVLVLVTLGSGNVVLERLFDPRRFAVTKLAVELFDASVDLPPHDVVFNAIGEADSARPALERASELLEKPHGRLLNDPQAVLPTGRAQIAQRLGGINDLVVPAVELLERDHVASRAWAYPLLLRAPGYHTGEHFVRVDAAGDLSAALASLPGDRLFAMTYVDVSGDDGLYAKYRVMAIGGELYPLHAAFGSNWKLHYVTSSTQARADLREREEAFLRDMRATLGERACRALAAIVERVGLDYMGIDFALDRNGAVVLFETNATMAVRHGESADRILAAWSNLVSTALRSPD